MATLIRRTVNSPYFNGATTMLPFDSSSLYSSLGVGGTTQAPSMVAGNYYQSGGSSQYVASFSSGGTTYIQPGGTNSIYGVGSVASGNSKGYSGYMITVPATFTGKPPTLDILNANNAFNWGMNSSYGPNYSFAADYPGYALDRGSNNKTNTANSLFAAGIGGAGQNNNGPFSSTRFNMGGQIEYIGLNDPRLMNSFSIRIELI